MGKITSPQPPFEIEGVKWDYWGPTTNTSEVQWCTSVPIDKHRNFAVWYYPKGKRGENFLCVWYRTGEFTADKDECWMGPLEAMALLHEALKGNWHGA